MPPVIGGSTPQDDSVATVGAEGEGEAGPDVDEREDPCRTSVPEIAVWQVDRTLTLTAGGGQRPTCSWSRQRREVGPLPPVVAAGLRPDREVVESPFDRLDRGAGG